MAKRNSESPEGGIQVDPFPDGRLTSEPSKAGKELAKTYREPLSDLLTKLATHSIQEFPTQTRGSEKCPREPIKSLLVY